MIKITDYIHCYENVLDKDLCKEIIKNSKNLNFEKAPTVEEMETEKNSNHRCNEYFYQKLCYEPKHFS